MVPLTLSTGALLKCLSRTTTYGQPASQCTLFGHFITLHYTLDYYCCVIWLAVLSFPSLLLMIRRCCCCCCYQHGQLAFHSLVPVSLSFSWPFEPFRSVVCVDCRLSDLLSFFYELALLCRFFYSTLIDNFIICVCVMTERREDTNTHTHSFTPLWWWLKYSIVRASAHNCHVLPSLSL